MTHLATLNCTADYEAAPVGTQVDCYPPTPGKYIWEKVMQPNGWLNIRAGSSARPAPLHADGRLVVRWGTEDEELVP